jgi:hypothetical protein
VRCDAAAACHSSSFFLSFAARVGSGERLGSTSAGTESIRSIFWDCWRRDRGRAANRTSAGQSVLVPLAGQIHVKPGRPLRLRADLSEHAPVPNLTPIFHFRSPSSCRPRDGSLRIVLATASSQRIS